MILNNEANFETLGFAAKKSKFYSELKRIEIEKRPKKYKQLSIFAGSKV